MVAPSTTPPNLETPSEGSPEERHRLRIRFRKGYDLRLLSHHDLMRTFERLLRRAQLPVRYSQGFNPKPRLIFALSLPLGVIGCEEVAEVELTDRLPLDNLRERVSAQMPPGLDLLSLVWVPPKSTAQVRTLTYRLALRTADSHLIDDLRDRLDSILEQEECLVSRTKPKPRQVNVRPFLRDLRLSGPCVVAETEATFALEMELELTSTGTARPSEILGLLGLESLLDEGALLERSRLELTDETTLESESLA